MKKLRYIYILLTAVLLGFLSFACSDDDVEQAEDDKSTDVREAKIITTTVKVCAVAPELASDLETRAGADNANIEHDRPENGGRFQNIVIVVTNDVGTVYGIHCNKWYDGDPTSAGVKQYEYIFPDLKIKTTSGDAKVYVFGNVDTDNFENICTDTLTFKAPEKDGDTETSISSLKVNSLLNASISVDEADLYKISFDPKKGNYKIGDALMDDECTGMPVNNDTTATVKKGATVFTVHMKRVCARLQVTFRNLTGQYKVYGKNKSEDNNVYVDKFSINNILATSTDYFCKKKDHSIPNGTKPFDILKALGGANNHVINKIKNKEDMVVSMYVFENKTTDDYKYDLKVDRGKSLGTNTTVIDTANAYVIWNNVKHNSIAYKESKICASREQEYIDEIPFEDQVLWKLEIPNNPKVKDPSYPYMLKHLEVDDDDKINETTLYFAHQEEKDWNQNDPSLVSVLTSKDFQYIQFSLQSGSTSTSYYTMNLLNSKHKTYGWINPTIPYNEGKSCWGKATRVGGERYYFLSVNDDNTLCKTRTEFLSGSSGLVYEWTLYAKYIIKNGAIQENGKDLTQITRNGSYELEYNVMPNYENEMDLKVRCVRPQKSIEWEVAQ